MKATTILKASTVLRDAAIHADATSGEVVVTAIDPEAHAEMGIWTPAVPVEPARWRRTLGGWVGEYADDHVEFVPDIPERLWRTR